MMARLFPTRFGAFVAVLLALALPAASLPAHGHDFFAALTRINHNGRAGTLEVIHRLTLHDIDVAVSLEAGEKISFLNEGQFDRAEAALGRYLARRFEIRTPEGRVTLDYLGAEVEGDVVYAYSEAPMASQPRRVSVRNRILFDVYERQRNTVVVTIGEGRGSSQFKPGDGEKTITPAATMDEG